MSEKTCWLVDEENGIATDGKRYWCAMKHWKCAKDMILVSELREWCEANKIEDPNTAICYVDYDDILDRFCEPKDLK